ncbi:MAG: GH3 auxin-responsive promoter family protein [Prevotellaceae bacterium]|jgi:hypothetical protein|nr:GH3 auxin-responsive promoter family protein [Prevotellaceae bacterium]
MLLNNLILSISKNRFKQVDYFCEHPFEAQEKVFRYLISRARDTEFGKQYNFPSINSIEAFQQNVPLFEYEAIKPFIDKMRQGQSNILWSSKAAWFAKSSGTTGSKSKYIPVTKESLHGCHFRGSKDVVLSHLRQYPKSKMLKGKSLTLGGSHAIDELSSNVKSGDLSAILIQNAPFYTTFSRAPKKATALIPDFETKLKRIAEETSKQNITGFAGVPSWNLVMMRYILDYTGKQNLLEIWPDLSFFMHGGISFGPYRKQFEAIIPSQEMLYRETYNASEGFFALQNDLSDSGMLLIMDSGVFYEFIPMSEFGTPNSSAITVADVKMGVSYAMIISTNSGLWRYIIGDTVEFTSLYPHKIKITGRTKHFINVFGEELMVHNAEQALSVACEAASAIVKEYTVAPIFMEERTKGAHEWVVEFEKAPVDYNDFADILDKELTVVNSDYEAKRAKSVTLNRLKLSPVPNGTFYEWMKQCGKLGGQNKVPRLYNSREYAEELLTIAKTIK